MTYGGPTNQPMGYLQYTSRATEFFILILVMFWVPTPIGVAWGRWWRMVIT